MSTTCLIQQKTEESQALPIDFQKFLHRWKEYKICQKAVQYFPTSLKCIAALPLYIKCSICCKSGEKCKQNALLLHAPILLHFVLLLITNLLTTSVSDSCYIFFKIQLASSEYTLVSNEMLNYKWVTTPVFGWQLSEQRSWQTLADRHRATDHSSTFAAHSNFSQYRSDQQTVPAFRIHTETQTLNIPLKTKCR